ncbi:Retrovirus-related Pol polyprotein from transposon TNT 1-94 [Araneus ventricosus]|uniref:Retrovirus-related Pol polyprotein from transposon TNT 1-94 n=1 Tax=Araneus ventricosus TaxID=182803 RepID=A0A4Y2JSM1_ARAVE|nr:Retrovirus-related Pol polyprotein from transposon TNT 1-94 [Araneus ventricosus]GBM92511.1 Retrovirus-related Pol polyprotein from transposon TNT 1-94 [Araneus ventricosus]
MIRSLPAEYQSIVQTIYQWTDAEFQPDKIESELLLEENRLRVSRKDLDTVSSIAFSNEMERKEAGNYYKQDEKLKTKSSKVRRFKNKTSNVKNKQIGPCYFRKSYGHLIANCKHKAALSNPKTNESSNTEFKVKRAFSELESNLIETFPDSHEANSSDFGQNTSWVFDTAATAHFCSNKSLYYSFEPVSNMQMTLAVGEKESPVEGKGIIHFLVQDKDGKFSDIILKDVLYNPNLRRNLLSGGKLERLGINFVGSKGKIHVYDKNWNELFYALRKNNLYFLKPSKYITMSKVKNESVNLSANQVEKVNTSDLWHERFCHINNDYVLNTSKNYSVKGLPKLFGLTEDCISCKLAKSRRVSFKSMGQIRSKRPLELLHMDLCGPLPVLSQGGNRYIFTIVDDFSRKVTVFPIRNKSDAFQTFIRFQKRAERFLNRKVISVRTNGGLEFCNQEFEKFLEKLGIRHEKTNPYSPEMNGVAERFNLTALDGVKSFIKVQWKPSVSHLKKFGCVAYVGVPKQTRKKLDMRAKLAIMCGYAQTTKGYRILLLEDQRVIETINVRFDETKRGVELVPDSKGSWFTLFKDFPEDGDIFSLADDDLINRSEYPRVFESASKPIVEMREITSLEQNAIPCKSIDWVRKAVPRSDGSKIDIYYGIEGTNVRLRSFNDVMGYCASNKIQCDKNLFNFSGKNTESGKVTDLLNLNEANLLEVRIPRTYKEAIKVLEASKWEDAMNRELKVMHERNVWELVKPPKDAKTLDDIILFAKNRKDLELGIDLLKRHFELKVLGKTKKLLGIEFMEVDGKLFIHQNSYINKVCNLYSKFKFPISSLPIPKGQVLSKLDSPCTKPEVEEMSNLPYRNLLGSLAFIAGRTRPDIMYVVNLLSQFQSNPGIKHWQSLLKLLGYLQSTRNYILDLSKVNNLNLKCYSASDFAANRDDRVSIGGYILFLDETPISWRTFKQRCVSLSTMEAEYVTLMEAAKELIWIKNVLNNECLNLNLKDCLLYCDNQAAIGFSNSPFENQ